METTVSKSKPFKLDYKRTMLIGFAFFGILLLWQVYDSWCPTLLSELFARTFNSQYAELRTQNTPEAIAACNDIIESYQYLVGVMMAIDNLAALILLPIFGRLSDKTRTPLGKRMPYILVGTAVCAIAFPFIPVIYHYVTDPGAKLAGVIVIMAIVVLFAMMYRNPAVSLMPDMTPKPLRSKANGIINIMGYLGGAFAMVVAIFFAVSDYLGTTIDKDTGLYKNFDNPVWNQGNFWGLEAPFLVASLLMIVSAVVLILKVRENEIAAKVKEEMERGEEYSESVDKVDDDKPLSKANKIMLFLILGAEFFWFMADNGVQTFMVNYTVYFIGAKSSSMAVATIIGGVGSVAGFVLGGLIAGKIGRKWTLISGLGLSLVAFLFWILFTFTGVGIGKGELPFWLYIIWFIKGLGMSLVHVNSYPMVVELCSSKKIGAYTGYYYASSMAAQTITPVLLGLLLLTRGFSWEFLPVYGAVCLAASLAIFFFVKNVKGDKTAIKKGLESLDVDE